MAAYRRVYDSRYLLAYCQEQGSAESRCFFRYIRLASDTVSSVVN